MFLGNVYGMTPNTEIVNTVVQADSLAFTGKESADFLRQSMTSWTSEQRKSWVDTKDASGKTRLSVLIEAKEPVDKESLIHFFVRECGADINQGDNQNWTPLYRSATGNQSSVLKLLLDLAADPKIQNKDGSTPLHRSVDRGNIEDVELLIEHGADINCINCYGSPLAYATKNGFIQIAKKLLEAGADPNAVDDPLAYTPLELAKLHGKKELEDLLVSYSAKLVIPLESSAHTFLSKQVDEENLEAVKTFEKPEIDDFGRSVAHYFAGRGKLNFLKEIAQAPFDEQDNKGRTPLHYAIIKGQKECVQFLINGNKKCKLDVRDHQGYSPLMMACQYDRIEIARTLLIEAEKRGILAQFLAITDNFGWTALHKAAQVGNLNMVKMLIQEYGMDHTQQTGVGVSGRTPLELAQGTKSEEVVHYLAGLKTEILTNKV